MPDTDHGDRLYVSIISLVAAAGGFLFGYDLAVVSGAIIFLKKEFSLTGYQLGFALASAQIGCMLAPLFSGPVIDRWGRKRVLLLAALLFAAAALGTALPRNMLQFNLFRILAGIAIGLASVVSPMYIAEISPASIRGRLVGLNQFAIVIGAMSSFVVSYAFSFSGNWRMMFACAAIPTLALMFGLLYIPESPRWLAQKAKFSEAREILRKIDGLASADREIAEIKSTLAEETGTWKELFSPGVRMAVVVGTGLCLFQGWSGGTAVNFYAPLIFQRASALGASRAILWTLLLNVSSVLLTTLAMFLVDKIGRRPLLLVGSTGMAIALFALGAALLENAPSTFTIVTVFLFNIFYQISVAPLAWLILSEIFPTRLRARGQSVGTMAVWISTYLSDQFLAPMMAFFERRFGSVGPAFWVFAMVCLGALLFGWRLVPETKQRTLEDIAGWWQRREAKNTSKSAVRTL